MMEKRLPGVPLPVSPVSLGTAQFGDSLGEKEACELLDVYTDRGGNLLDTANCYGRWLPLCGSCPKRAAFQSPLLFWHGWPGSLSPLFPSRPFPVCASFLN